MTNRKPKFGGKKAAPFKKGGGRQTNKKKVPMGRMKKGTK